jgi:ABC transporter ATM
LANANIVPKPEAGKAKDTPKKDLLSESAIASKEQRRADWAIMREMAKYLWPKVLA